MPLRTSWGCLYQVHHACTAKENGESCGCYCHQAIQQNNSNSRERCPDCGGEGGFTYCNTCGAELRFVDNNSDSRNDAS